MKLINLSLITALVFGVLFGIHNFKISELENNQYITDYYKTQIENAAEDASYKLKTSVSIVENGLFTETEIRHEEIFDEFFKLLSLSLNLNTEEEISILKNHFPILAIVEEDGIVFSSIRVYEEEGYHYKKRIVMPKTPFYFEDKGVFYFPRLSGEVEVLYLDEGIWKEEIGTPDYLLSIPDRSVKLEFLEQPEIEKKLKTIIAEQISEKISLELERLNKTTGDELKSYDFYLPAETYTLAEKIQSASFVSFLQGYRLNGTYDIDLSISQRLRIESSDFFVGFEMNGVKYYCREDYSLPEGTELIEAFSNEIEAAKAGYYEYGE